MFKGKLWIFLVLTSFSLLLVPKNLWHDCERYHTEDHHENHPKQKSFHSASDCPICDFELYTATVHEFPVFRFAKVIYQHPDLHAESQCIVPLKHLKLRGPPAMIS